MDNVCTLHHILNVLLLFVKDVVSLVSSTKDLQMQLDGQGSTPHLECITLICERHGLGILRQFL
jgi:hypothetical protein